MPEAMPADDLLAGRDRYVVLGLADRRAAWLVRVGRWATEASLPVELVRTSSPGELRALLETRRPFSSVLIDGRRAGAGRDLIDTVRRFGCVPVVVDGSGAVRDWSGLGAAAVLEPGFDRDALIHVLAVHTRPIADRGARAADDLFGRARTRGALVAVTGPAQVDRGAVAIAAAAGLGRVRARGRVALVDFCLDAGLADRLGVDAATGVQELIEGHRWGHLSSRSIEELFVPMAGFDLLAGLRDPDDWPSLGAASTAAALAGLRRARRTLVVTTDPDVSGELETGSLDLEDRHALARAAIANARALVVVGRDGDAGLDRLGRTITRVARSLRPGAVVVPVLHRGTHCGRGRRARRDALSATVMESDRAVMAPVRVPTRDDEVPSASAADRVARAVTAALGHATGVHEHDPIRRVQPGELGWWTDDAG